MGTTYTGSYDESIYTPNAFLIGPGVAPLVDLYAYRVFGCSGYTDLVVDAIDRAIADDVDVINMSLGSDFGFDSALFADIVASNNAVRAGIIVVTASGNSGPIPYITGSPASADSAIAVAAIDSHETYPGANITTVDGKFISVQNSNNFALVDGTIYTLIIIKDNPSTAHYDESLGCNVGDFPSSMPPSTLVVVNRGVCGRAAKAINGQHAGAAAVIMINTDLTGYPPFEGSVPDLNIPFFGAELSDNATLMLYNDTQVSLKNIQLPNPTAATVTSFSSGGPRGGDSYLKPEIAGPGARIVSTAIGTGYKGLTLSGTSMATPHVAGVAALVRQAHPTWTAVEIKAAIMSTANATRIVGLNPRLAGAGLVNPVAAIQTNVWAAGVASSDHFGATAVNFGYVELTSILHSVKGFVNLCNRGNDSVSFVASVGNINGVPHIVSLNSTLIQLDGSQNATIGLTLQIPATTAGNSSGFYDASGTIIFTPLGSGNNGVPLSVPYYIVPRSISSLNASIQQLGNNASYFNVSVNNSNGPIAAQSVNLFSWGIHVDEDTNSTYSSVRAVGVISMPNPNGSVTNPIIQFAVNTYKRWSSPSTVAFDIYIDADPQNMNGIDYVVRSIDYGLFNSANPIGKLGTFILSTRSPGYYTLDPGATYASTDSSVMIIPLWRSFLCRQKEPCVNSTNARFSYQIRSYDMIFGTNWSYTALGWYNPFSSSITFSSPKMGPIGFGAANISIVRINPSVWNSTPALGVLVVAADNKSGRDQAIELAFPRPTGMPSIMPTKIPSTKPSRQPTVDPIANPTATPIANPTKKPLAKPTAKPVPKPTQKPSTTHPSAAPTKHPRRKSRRPRVRKSRRPRHVRKSRRPRTLGSTA
jgi:minor extracellular serine protease Vpr